MSSLQPQHLYMKMMKVKIYSNTEMEAAKPLMEAYMKFWNKMAEELLAKGEAKKIIQGNLFSMHTDVTMIITPCGHHTLSGRNR